MRLIGGTALYFVLSQLPVKVELADSLPFAVCITLALLMSTLLGMILYAAVFRRVRTALPLAKVVASLGAMGLLQSVVAFQLGTSPPVIAPIFPADGIEIGSAIVRQDVLTFFGAVIAMVIGASALYRYTRLGRATTASADSEKGATALGFSPDAIALVNWAIAGLVAGLSGILIAPLAQVTPTNFTLFVVPALAAALVGRFTSIWPAVLVATALGMVQSEVVLLRTHEWWPQIPGIAEALPLVVIIIVMVVNGKPLPERGAISVQDLPRARPPRAVLPGTAITIAVVAVLLLTLDGGYLAGLIATLVFIPFALSVVILTGYVGQISLAQFAFAGIAAFSLSKLTAEAGVPFPLAPVLAALIAAVIGVVIGLPALRVRGITLAVLTLSSAVAIDQLVFRNPDLSGGPTGAPIERPSVFGVEISYPNVSYGVFALTVAVLTALVAVGIRRSRLGYQMLAVRANERAAAAAGINVALIKLLAFGIAAFFAGIGGVVYAYQFSAVSPDSFTVLAGIGLFATIYVAGVTSASGGLVAGFISAAGLFAVVMQRRVHLGEYYDVLLALGLIVAAISHPEGISGAVQMRREERRARRAEARVVAAASTEMTLKPIERAVVGS
jgi:ABC-type branched-subunit amino acid transport system permease subunit